jgi:hypothetical protein
MKHIFLFGIFLAFVLSHLQGQTLCTKFTVIKPVISTETTKVVVTPATYKTEYQYFTVKQGYWDIEYKNGLPCKTWRDPERILIAVLIQVQEAVYKDVAVSKVERQGDVIAYVSECN